MVQKKANDTIPSVRVIQQMDDPPDFTEEEDEPGADKDETNKAQVKSPLSEKSPFVISPSFYS